MDPVPRRGIHSVTVLDRTTLKELGWLGERAVRAAAVAAVRELLAGMDHPVASDVERVLFGGGGDHPSRARPCPRPSHTTPLTVRCSRNVYSRPATWARPGRWLGYAPRSSSGLGPLGIREGAALTLLGGAGRVALAGSASLDPAASRETAMTISRLELPSVGLVSVT